MEAVVEKVAPVGDVDIDTYNDWKAQGFPNLKEFAKTLGVGDTIASQRITKGIAKLKTVKEPGRYHVRVANFFIKHIPSQTFCACFRTEEEATRFMASKPDHGRDYWIYAKRLFKRHIGLDPDHIIIHSEYA